MTKRTSPTTRRKAGKPAGREGAADAALTGIVGGPIRLQRWLSLAGVASRRKAETLIEEGHVRLNGRVVTELGTKAGPGDRVTVDGKEIHLAVERRYYILNKPRGYLCTASDPEGRKTIYSLLPPGLQKLRHVGRLDRESEGLVFLTDDGDIANRVMHPRYGVLKVYRAIVEGRVGRSVIDRLEEGIELEDGLAQAEGIRIRKVEDKRTDMLLGIREGRKHEVRRMMEAVGHPVKRLQRLALGPLTMRGIRPGEWRSCDMSEIEALSKGEGTFAGLSIDEGSAPD